MNRLSKQQDNQAHGEPRVFPPVQTESRHRFQTEIAPLRSGLSFFSCHPKVDHYLNPR